MCAVCIGYVWRLVPRSMMHVLWYTGSAYLVFTANSTMLEDPWTPLPQPYSTALPRPVAFHRQSFHFDTEEHTGPAYTQMQNSTPLEGGPWTPLPVKRHRGEPG